MFGPGCCCNAPPDCGQCSDTAVVFLLTLSDIVDDVAIPDPPGLHDCPACSTFNATLPLVLGSSPFPSFCITMVDPPAFGIEGCYYTGVTGCNYTEDGLCPEQMQASLRGELWVYRSSGGDVRGYLLVTQFVHWQTHSADPFCFGQTSGDRLVVSAADFLLGADVEKIPCLAVDIEEMDLTICSDTGPIKYYCDAPTGFTLAAVAA